MREACRSIVKGSRYEFSCVETVLYGCHEGCPEGTGHLHNMTVGLSKQVGFVQPASNCCLEFCFTDSSAFTLEQCREPVKNPTGYLL